MAIVVSAPDAFFDAEPWEFDLTVRQPDNSGPMDLTGSRLYVAFRALADGAAVGICDTISPGTLTITDALAGKARFTVPSVGRTWRVPTAQIAALVLRATVVGDLFRLPPGIGALWTGVARIEIGVLPSTGLPTS